MEERQVTEQQIDGEEVDEEKIREMVDLEEQLLEERQETDAESVEEAAQGDVGDRDEAAVSGTIRNVREKRGHIAVEFFADGDVWEDTLPMPDDASDPEATVNRLCRLCGVPEGRVADLQGESVPVEKSSRREEYSLRLPSTTAAPARAVFRLWWWLRRRGVSTPSVKARRAALIASGAVLYFIGMRTLWMAFVGGWGDADPGAFGAALLPFISPETASGGVLILAGIVGLLSSFVAAFSIVVTLVGVAYAGWKGVQKFGSIIDEKCNPF